MMKEKDEEVDLKSEPSDPPKEAEPEPDENPNQGFMYYLVTKHMWIIAFLVIPISLAYDFYWKIRTTIAFWRNIRTEAIKHEAKVEDVQKQVQDWIDEGSKVPMCTARPGWKSITLQRLTYKDRLHQIKIDMPDILSIDEEQKFVRVEPMVSIGQLNDFLVKRGWTLPVVPELDDLTIGGLVMGGGIESTSHKYGLFQYICRRFEMVLGDARRVVCSPTENPELFSAIPFSYGTLGFLVSVDIDIIPYKPYIKLYYYPVKSISEVVEVFTRETNNPEVDSVEGIMFSPDEGVIMAGYFVDKVDDKKKLNKIGRWYKPWFYKHVQSFIQKKSDESIEYIPTDDFYHRHNKSYFWLMPYIVPIANNPVFRFLLGWSMPPKFSLLKLMRQNLLPKEQNVNFVCQDFGFEMSNLKEALVYVDEQTKVYPIWLCPTRHVIHKGCEEYSMFKKEHVHVDVGIYGYSPIEGYDAVATQRRMERFAIDHGAYVAPYAETQLTLEEYYEMFSFNIRIYEKVKKDLGAEKAFPHIYEKISKLGRS